MSSFMERRRIFIILRRFMSIGRRLEIWRG